MRKRFEQQLSLGQVPISNVKINCKGRDGFSKLLRALQELFIKSEYNEKIFNILEQKIMKGKKATGRNGMDLWMIFVLAQTRLCLNVSYDRLHDLSNNHRTLRQIMGIEYEDGFKERVEIEYQNIIDNVSLLDDSTIQDINEIIVEMGHNVFKKKEAEALCLKTDSFVVESNIHFPTDYNLMFDSARKSLDMIEKLISANPAIKGWRKLNDWRNSMKSLMRNLGQAQKGGGKNKDERKLAAAENYVKKGRLLSQKIDNEKKNLPLITETDLVLHILLDKYKQLLDKHIDLVLRRIIKGEEIPHHEKTFSIFEEYTEWITKGKQYPNVELGKNLQITTDQHHLIIDYKIMENEVDKGCVISLADRILSKFVVKSWSFDKGFYSKENKELLKLYVALTIMPKKGKLNQEEKAEEKERKFKKFRNKHSAVESNINELECKGLDRCPDRGYDHFRRYIALGICSYNLHRIGAKLLKDEKEIQRYKIAA